ncbi:OmpA family protein [Acidisoma sp. 7E03]
MGALLLLLGGCSAAPKSINPVSWWHGLEGGAIAEDRPPPPKANAPFPHIAAAPTRPAGMPDWEWQELQKTLAAQGAAAHQYAAENPIPTLPQAPGATGSAAATPSQPATKPAAAPAQPAATTAAAPSAADQDAIRRLAAAQGPAGAAVSTPPAATVAAASAASGQPATAGGAGSQVTLAAPDSTPTGSGPAQVPVNGSGQVATSYKAFDANNGLSIPGALSPVAQPDEAHPPPVPTSVPAPAQVPGFAIPAVPSTYVPPKAVAQPAPYVPPPPLPNVPPVPVAFLPGSAILSPPMQHALANLAQSRQGNRIAVIGFGDAADSALADQRAALPLALERARAITVQLMADGVPPAQLATAAAAQGRGGLARLVD